MDKNTILQLAAVGATVALAAVVKVLAPQPSVSLFGYSQPSIPSIKMPDSAEVAAEKTAAIKELVNSDAFKQALPSAQKQMLQTVKDIFN